MSTSIYLSIHPSIHPINPSIHLSIYAIYLCYLSILSIYPSTYICRYVELLPHEDENVPLLSGECDDTTKTTLHSRLEERVRELLVDNARLGRANANMQVCTRMCVHALMYERVCVQGACFACIIEISTLVGIFHNDLQSLQAFRAVTLVDGLLRACKL